MRLTSAPGVLLGAAILSVAAILSACGEERPSQPIARRPERFGQDDQYSVYLKELQDYYGVHGRGRYGKRQMRAITSDVYVGDEVPPQTLPAPLLYPRFQQYQRNLQALYQFQ